MNQLRFRTPLRIALRAGVAIALCAFWVSVALAQAAQPAPLKEAGARVTETQVLAVTYGGGLRKSTMTEGDIHMSGIDFIASGHTHTFMEKLFLQKNPEGNDTIIFQVGKSGIYVGRIDFKMKDGKVVASAGRLLDLRHESLA